MWALLLQAGVKEVAPPSMLIHYVGADIAQMLAEKYGLTAKTDVVPLRLDERDIQHYEGLHLPETVPYSKLGSFDPVRLGVLMELVTDGTYLFAAGYDADHDVVVVRRRV